MIGIPAVKINSTGNLCQEYEISQDFAGIAILI